MQILRYFTGIAMPLFLFEMAFSDEPVTTSTPAIVSPGLGIHEEWLGGGTGSPLGSARDAFVAFDLPLSAGRIRQAAKDLNSAAANAADDSRESLRTAAADLELLAKKIEAKEIAAVEEIDRRFAHAYQAAAQHQYRAARQHWNDGSHEQSGRRLQAAVANLESAYSAAGRRMNEATVAAVRGSRAVSGKLIAGAGYGVEEVGVAFSAVGTEVERIGQAVAPLRKRDPVIR